MTTSTYEQQPWERSEIARYLDLIGSIPIPSRTEITQIAVRLANSRSKFRKTLFQSDFVLAKCFEFLKQVFDKKIRYDRAFDVYHRNFQKLNAVRALLIEIVEKINSTERPRLNKHVENLGIRIGHIEDWFDKLGVSLCQTSSHEETRIWNRASEYRLAYHDSKQALAQSGLRLAFSIAKRYSSHNLSLMDLIQEGNSGLMVAAEKFDPELGFAFSTYATRWIQQSISFAIHEKTRVVRLPIGLTKRLAKAHQQLQLLSQHNLRKNSSEEELPIVSACRHVNRWYVNYQKGFVSIDQQSSDDESRVNDFDDTTVEPPNSAVHRQHVIAEIKRAVGILDARRRKIVELRFGLNGDTCSRRSIGEQLGISHERVRQLEVESLESLKIELRCLADV